MLRFGAGGRRIRKKNMCCALLISQQVLRQIILTLRHAVARVAKLVRRLLPGTAKDKCKVISYIWACATLQHRIYNKPLILKPANLAFNIYLFIPAGFCHHAIFPQLRRVLRGDCGRIRLGEKPLCKGTKIFTVHGRTESKARNEDHGGRDEPFEHDVS